MSKKKEKVMKSHSPEKITFKAKMSCQKLNSFFGVGTPEQEINILQAQKPDIPDVEEKSDIEEED
ncbi:MAG TPA: hypothetical protein VJI75_05010 [Candidatus Nanoarchaeia archaeon]|nr:hypothetical protein [Candidatus Nanoarchaeia archaeon]